jgi:hypothetical protein
MRITPPRTVAIGDEVLISSRIEVHGRSAGFPRELWFRFPSSCQPSEDSDPFVVALLLLAMQNGEDIEVKGTLSRKVFEGMERYQTGFSRLVSGSISSYPNSLFATTR